MQRACALILWMVASSCFGQPFTLSDQSFLGQQFKSSGAVVITNVTGSLSNWWKFDDVSGTTATNAVVVNVTDSGALGFDAGGANPSWVAGKIGGALSFDGVGSKVTMATNNPNGSVPCTISAWLYRTSTPGTFLYDSDSDSQSGWFCYISSGKVFFDVASAGSDQIVSITDTSSASTWYHVCITWDGVNTSTAGTHIYINGSEGSYVTQTPGGGAHSANTTGARYIGRGATGAAFYWPGNIDDVRVYGRALSAGEVNMLYQWSGQP